MSAPIPKHGKILLPTLLEWTRQRACVRCSKPAPVDPHHVELKGRGITDDSLVAPYCRLCHGEAHLAKIGRVQQDLDALWNLRACLLNGGRTRRHSLIAEIDDWDGATPFKVQF